MGLDEKKKRKKIQLDHASPTDPRSTDVFGRGLYDHCSITHWKCRDSRKEGFQPASCLPLLPSASPHLPLPTGFPTVLRCLWVTTALPWHPHNTCEIQGVMQTPEYATSLFLIHSEQVGAILTRMVNISILHFGKYSLNKKPS